ncbi:MAG: hypothetical protein A2W29_08165 [Gemmatimonadetes bacterium RBG_16_66_8]|nr:MAG: hypothetical protein A2W29_08165 [Gemmatimonadetes bacterium RBG_16_66_8]
MRCTDFLHLYSDYRDGRLRDRALETALEHHLRECVRCARFDLVLRRGVDVLQTAPQIEPSPAFRRTLRLRLFATPMLDPFPAPGLAVASLLVAAAVALFVLEGVTRRSAVDPPTQPQAQVVVNPGPPFVGFAGPSLVQAVPASLASQEDADSAARAASVAP